jgi:hypothetical protein
LTQGKNVIGFLDLVLFFQADRMVPMDASKGMKVSIKVMVLRIIQMSIRASMMDNARKSGAERQSNQWASAWLYVEPAQRTAGAKNDGDVTRICKRFQGMRDRMHPLSSHKHAGRFKLRTK